jgi:endonuclease III
VATRPELDEVVRRLERCYGRPARPPHASVFEAIVAENVAYLVDDTRRQATLEALRGVLGTSPSDVLKAGKDKLIAAIEGGGMHAALRASKLLEAAKIAEELGEDLDVIARRPLAEARRVLKRFPGFGGAAADKLLMTWGGHPVLALDSNGLRVLQRLGFARAHKSYDRSYREVQAAIAPELPATPARRYRAHALLRMHGQQTCRTSRPSCSACVLRDTCPSRVSGPK